MNTTPRRIDRTITPEEARKVFDEAEYGYLSLVSDDEYPYGIPVNFALLGNFIYIHSAPEGRKIECCKKDARASICVVGRALTVPDKFTVSYKSAVAFGLLSIISDTREKMKALRLLVAKLAPEYRKDGDAYIEKAIGRTAILRLEISGISGKQNPIRTASEKI